MDGDTSSEATERDRRLLSACLTRDAASLMRSLGTLYSSQRRCNAVICASRSARVSERRLTKLMAPRWSRTPCRTVLSAAESARGSSAFTDDRSSNMVGSDLSSRPYMFSATPFGDCAVVGEPGAGSGKEVRESVSSCGGSRGRLLEARLSSPIIETDAQAAREAWLLMDYCCFARFGSQFGTLTMRVKRHRGTSRRCPARRRQQHHLSQRPAVTAASDNGNQAASCNVRQTEGGHHRRL